MTERAIAALKLKSPTVEAVEHSILKENAIRDAILNGCDQEYYKLDPADHSLLQFVEDHQRQIQLARTDDYPRREPVRELGASSKLGIHLFVHSLRNKGWTPSLEEARKVTIELAQQEGITATTSDIEGAATLLVFGRSIRKGDVALARSLAPRTFELMHEDGNYVIAHRDWVQLLIQSGELESADRTTLYYLEHMAGFDQSTERAKNYVLFWAPLLQENREALPHSVAFFIENFPAVDLDKPIPVRRIFKGRTPPRTGPRNANSE